MVTIITSFSCLTLHILTYIHILKQPSFDASEGTNNVIFVPPNEAETGCVFTR